MQGTFAGEGNKEKAAIGPKKGNKRIREQEGLGVKEELAAAAGEVKKKNAVNMLYSLPQDRVGCCWCFGRMCNRTREK